MVRKLKWLVIFLLLFYLILFITANNQSITVYYLWNKPLFGYKPVPKEIIEKAQATGQPIPEPSEPREIPLILVLFTAFLFGVVVSSLFGSMQRFRFSSQIRQEKRGIKTEKKRLIQEEKERQKLEKQKLKEDKKKEKEEKKREKANDKKDSPVSSDQSKKLLP